MTNIIKAVLNGKPMATDPQQPIPLNSDNPAGTFVRLDAVIVRVLEGIERHLDDDEASRAA